MTQLDCRLAKLSRYSRATALVLRYSNAPAGGDVGHVGMIGLKGPTDKGGKTARFVLQLPQSFQVFDPLGERFDVAEHHRRRAAAAELVPDAVDVEPIVGQHFAARDRPRARDRRGFPRRRRAGCPGRPP